MAHAGKPIPPRKMARCAELIGMGLSHSETAGACGISERSVLRILSKPEYKRMAEETAKRRTSIVAQAGEVVQELLSAVDHKGEPDKAARQRGAEIALKHPDILAVLEELEDDEALLPGVVLRFPWAQRPEYSLENASEEGAEAASTPRAESENGLTLAPEPQEPPADLDLEPGDLGTVADLFSEEDYETEDA